MENSTMNTANAHASGYKCISWSAIVIGALIAISLSFLLNMLSIGIGLAAFPAATDSSTAATSLAVGSFVGLIIFAVLAMFPAGYVAGLLGTSSCVTRKMGEIYGAATWGLALILTILCTSSIAQFVNQTGYLVNRQQVLNIRVTELPNNEVVRATQVPATRGNAAAPAVNSVQVDPDKAAQAAGAAAFGTFCIFFLGFIAACLGGRYGENRRMRCLNNHVHSGSCDIRK